MGIAQSAPASAHEDDFLPVFQDLRFFFPAFFIKGDGTKGYININVFTAAAGTIVATAAFPVFCQDILVIPKVQEGPEIFIAPEYNMRAATTVTAIRAGFCVEFGSHEMLAACASMATAAKDPDLVYKVRFL
jgi:hypothetical protein